MKLDECEEWKNKYVELEEQTRNKLIAESEVNLN